jgi:DNA helicase TIP49 (TBP-interacting protein)
MKNNKASLNDDILLVNAIRKAVGNTLKDDVKIFTGLVTDVSTALTDGTISVQQITGKVNTYIQEKDPMYSYNQQKNDNLTTNLNNQTGQLIWDSVQLQASPGDALLLVPKLNSYVKVAYSTFQTPFVIQ